MGPQEDLLKHLEGEESKHGMDLSSLRQKPADQMGQDPSPPPTNIRREISTDGTASLLAMARQRINEGNPSLALQAVVIALRASGGERAVLQALGRAREMYHTRQQSNVAVDELSALLAECALATEYVASNAANATSQTRVATSADPSVEQEVDMVEHRQGTPLSTAAPILAESGRLQVVMDASSDGSSFVCVQCGGVVSNQRRDEHVAFWCSRTYQ